MLIEHIGQSSRIYVIIYFVEEAEEVQHCSLPSNLLVLTWSSSHCTLIAKDMQGVISKSDAQTTRLLVRPFHTRKGVTGSGRSGLD